MKGWRAWTEAENVYIRDHYMTTPNAVLGRLFDRSPKAVSNQIVRLGLPARPGQVAPVLPTGWKEREWTAEEEALLSELGRGATDEQIGRKLGRTKRAVQSRRARLGIRKRLTLDEIDGENGAEPITPKRNRDFLSALRNERSQEPSHAQQG